MIEKIFILLFFLFIGLMLTNHIENYNHSLRTYYFCLPKDKKVNPDLPLLSKYEFENFNQNSQSFTQNYICTPKEYTPKQFYTIRKSFK